MYTKSKLLLRTFLYFKISDNYFSIEKSVLFIFWRGMGNMDTLKPKIIMNLKPSNDWYHRQCAKLWPQGLEKDHNEFKIFS